MPSKALKERKNSLGTCRKNEAFVVLVSASGRNVGFIVDIGRSSIPFSNPAAREFCSKESILDILLDGSFLPFDTGESIDFENVEFSDTVFDSGLRFQQSLQLRSLTGKHVSELEFFLKQFHMTEN